MQAFLLSDIFLYFTTIAMICVFAVSLVVLHKSRRIHLKTYEILNATEALAGKHLIDQYRQIQSLLALEKELDLVQHLPLLRGWAASPDFLMVLAKHVAEKRPQVIVECSSGASTLVLARSLQRLGKGHVYSLENDPLYASKTRQSLVESGLVDWATVIDAPLMNQLLDDENWQWYSLDDLPDSKIDMLVIDGPHYLVGPMARYPAGPMLFSKLAPHGVVLLDDAARADEVAIIARWRQEWPDFTVTKHECEKGCVTLAKGFAPAES